jgi:phosphatidylglycerophosphate synthase
MDEPMSLSVAISKQWEAGVVKFIWWVLAWVFTGSRFIASLIIFVAISHFDSTGINHYAFLSYFFIGAMATDLFDGFCAKRAGSHDSVSGKACDPVADYALVGFTLIALYKVGNAPVLYTATILSGISFLAFFKVVAKHEKIEYESNLVAKVNVAIQMVVVYALLAQNDAPFFPAFTVWVAYLGVFTPIITFPIMAWSYKEKFREGWCKFREPMQ